MRVGLLIRGTLHEEGSSAVDRRHTSRVSGRKVGLADGGRILVDASFQVVRLLAALCSHVVVAVFLGA